MRPYRIDESEKKRILTLHKNATKNGYLSEQKEDASTMRVSQVFWDHIKEYEGNPKKRINGVKEPMYNAYKDSKGIWTIGYGHTEGVIDGMEITKQQALDFLYSDSKDAADCVRRMAKEWKSQDVNYTFTQGQFDALVSIVFNVGCDGMRTSDFIQELKKGNDQEAGEMIKTFALSGGEKRRKKESEIFLS